MKYRTPEFVARKTRALCALHTLLAMAGMPADARNDGLLAAFVDYLYLPDAGLIAVPWASEEGDIRSKVAAARAAFTHALMVTLGRANDGSEMAVISVGYRKGGEVGWSMRLQPWMGATSDRVWLVPIEPDGQDRTFCFADNRLVEAVPDPWPVESHRDLGLAMARDILFELMDRR